MSERVKVATKTPEVSKNHTFSQTRKSDSSHSKSSPMSYILFLHRTIGNRAVERLFRLGVIQAKLKIGQPNDIYEQEADRIAEQVMRMPEPHASKGKGERAKGRGEKVKSSCDQNQIMRVSESSCPECKDNEDKKVQPKPIADQITPLVKGQVEPEEEEETIQPKAENSQSREVTPDLESRINSLKGGGQPLAHSVRNSFEPRFGYDFSQVRVHTDSKADEAARFINAKAFTTGRNMVFGTGQYSPETSTGKRLLAHELVHVIQQGSISTQDSLEDKIKTIVRYNTPVGFQKIKRKIIQCAQIGRITVPAVGNPYFTYELDSTRYTYSQLATYYGTSVSRITAANPGKSPGSLHRGDHIRVPALHPPLAISGTLGETGQAGMTVNTTTAAVDIKWSPHSDSNNIGRLDRGASIPELFGRVTNGYISIFIDPNNLQRRADGIMTELIACGLTSGPSSVGNYVLGYAPENNVRETARTVTEGETNLLARMIWGEQRSQGRSAMICAGWTARNRYERGWGKAYSNIIVPSEFGGIASRSAVKRLTGRDLSLWNEAQNIAQSIISGTIPDPTGGQGLYFGNGSSVHTQMRNCQRSSPRFVFENISGTNLYWSNGDYTSSLCTIP